MKFIAPIHIIDYTGAPGGVQSGFKKFYLKDGYFKLFDGTTISDVVLGRPLDNYTPTAGTITANDTVLTALEKLDYAISNINPQQSLQLVVNAGNAISNFGGTNTADIQSTNFVNNRTLYLNNNAFATIKIVDNLNAAHNLTIDLDTININGVSYNWSSIVSPPPSILSALPFTTDHLAITNNQYLIGDVVYYLGDVYRCIANNDSIIPTNTLYWVNIGPGFPIVQQPVDWNSTNGNNQILNKPTIPGGTVTGVTATSPITSSGGTAPVISTSMATNKLIGRSTAGTGVMEEIVVGAGLSLSGGTLSATSVGIPHATALGTDTYTATISNVTSYADGNAYLIRFTNGNTTGSTLNINSLGAVPLYRNNDGPLLGGDITSGGEMLCVYNSTSNIFQVIGISPNSLYAYVTNADSVTITKGMPVYAFGGTGDRMTVKRAFNTGDATSAQTVGLVLSTSIAANQKGLIMMQGLLDGLSILPTSTFSDGDPIYLGATAGTITNVKPYAPNHLVYLGVVTTASNGSAGRMYVRVQNGYELDELHNVQARTPSLKDILWYDNTVSPAQWKTASIATILGYTPQPSSTRRNANNSTNSNINYCGVALGTGVSDAATVWTIKRLTISAAGVSTVATATNVAWTNRETAIYT